MAFDTLFEACPSGDPFPLGDDLLEFEACLAPCGEAGGGLGLEDAGYQEYAVLSKSTREDRKGCLQNVAEEIGGDAIPLAAGFPL